MATEAPGGAPSRKRFAVGITVVGLLVAGALAAKIGIDREQEERARREAEAHAALAEGEATIDQIAAAQRASESRKPTLLDAALDRARSTWARFDALRGDQFRTAAMLQAHRLQADQGLDYLPPADAAAVRRFNSVEFRRRLPTVLVPGVSGHAEGDDATIFVPSGDRSQCATLAANWANAPARVTELSGAGFASMRCEGGKSWPLQR